MSGLSASQLLFYGGIGVMALAVLAAVLAGVVFTLSGRRLRRKLEEEYGEMEAEVTETLARYVDGHLDLFAAVVG